MAAEFFWPLVSIKDVESLLDCWSVFFQFCVCVCIQTHPGAPGLLQFPPVPLPDPDIW